MDWSRAKSAASSAISISFLLSACLVASDILSLETLMANLSSALGIGVILGIVIYFLIPFFNSEAENTEESEEEMTVKEGDIHHPVDQEGVSLIVSSLDEESDPIILYEAEVQIPCPPEKVVSVEYLFEDNGVGSTVYYYGVVIGYLDEDGKLESFDWMAVEDVEELEETDYGPYDWQIGGITLVQEKPA